jgi:SNF2 family DNA or RNA helicase
MHVLNAGDFVFDKINNETVQIISTSEAWGYTSYRVYNPSTDAVYKLSSDSVAAASTETASRESYVHYVALLSKIKNETAGGVLSRLPGDVIPLPHQLHVLNRALSNNNIRYILADEVGLGKTVEAGLIIKELKARGLSLSGA